MNPFGRRKTDQSADQQAIARYRYLLKTAPPETIEQAHAEAFAQLTPEQRRLVLEQITQQLPAWERPLADQDAALSPQALARLASRAEMRQPGSVMAGSLLSSIAGAVIGSMIARQFFDGTGHWQSAEADPAADDNFDMGGDFDV
jgi:hypothetical protein